MTSRIEWVRGNCRLLAGISAEFGRTRPLQGITIGTGIHLEPKTAALLLTLADGGARVVSTGNLSSTQADVVAYLRDHGIDVAGGTTTDQAEHDLHLEQVLAARPDLLLDNGGDLFVRYLADPYPGLRGGTEETTSGRMRLQPLAGQLNLPVLVINDSPIKQFAENRHAVGQSVLESYQRITTGADLDLLGDGVVLCNAGHFPTEIAVRQLLDSPRVVSQVEAAEGITTLRLDDGRRIHLLTRGHMVNLAGPRPLGNSIESMDLGFALQARCLEAVASGTVSAAVTPVPAVIDRAVASAFLDAYGSPGCRSR